MRRVTFFRVALLVPILVPALLWLFARWLPMSDADAEVAGIFMYSLPVAGVPYIVFAAGFAWWMRDKPVPRIRRAVLRAPVLFIPFAWCAAVVMGVLYGSIRDNAHIGWLLILGVFSLLVGYTYVGVVMGAEWLAERLGWFLNVREA